MKIICSARIGFTIGDKEKFFRLKICCRWLEQYEYGLGWTSREKMNNYSGQIGCGHWPIRYWSTAWKFPIENLNLHLEIFGKQFSTKWILIRSRGRVHPKSNEPKFIRCSKEENISSPLYFILYSMHYTTHLETLYGPAFSMYTLMLTF